MRLTSRSHTARLRPRPGMTMVEVMVVVVLLSIVGGTVMSVLAKQQAFYRSTSDVMDVRSQLRQASAILANDLRGVASSSGDILAANEASIEFYYTLGSSVACQILGGTILTMPPKTLGNGSVLTDWVSRPQRGDFAIIYTDTDTTSSSDDGWSGFVVDTVEAGNALCNSTSKITQPSDDQYDSYRLRLNSSGSIGSGIRAGATIRFIRRAYYALYQSSADGRWYLGYCSPTCTSTNPIQAVAGPFNAPSSGSGTSGLRFTYYDANGNVTTDRTAVARISIVLRAQTRAQINVSGMGKGYYTDSLRTDVALRNRI